MLRKLREVLLTEYIGAFLIALLVWQAMVEIVARIVRIGYWIAALKRSPVVASYSRDPFRWDGLVLTFVSMGIYLAAAYCLAKWLYRQDILKVVGESHASPAVPEK